MDKPEIILYYSHCYYYYNAGNSTQSLLCARHAL